MSDRIVSEYYIIHCEGRTEFVNKVNSYLDAGWSLYGDTKWADEDEWSQAVVKYSNEDVRFTGRIK